MKWINKKIVWWQSISPPPGEANTLQPMNMAGEYFVADHPLDLSMRIVQLGNHNMGSVGRNYEVILCLLSTTTNVNVVGNHRLQARVFAVP
jgi:hypothetical protein